MLYNFVIRGHTLKQYLGIFHRKGQLLDMNFDVVSLPLRLDVIYFLITYFK